MVDHQRWFNVESTLKTNLSVWNLSWFSTLIQRWINVDDQPYFPWKLRLILNVDSTLNQRWESTLISKWLKNGWNLVEFWFSWRMVDDQRWFNVENLICAHWDTKKKKKCALWKHGLTSKNTQSQLTYFCKPNINQTLTNGGGMIWGVRIAIFTEIRHLVEELITFLSTSGP